MKILMLVSELWPVFSGGLGIAAYELVKNVESLFPQVTFKIAIPRLNWKGDLKAEIIETPTEIYSVYFERGEPNLDWGSIGQFYKFNYALARACEKKEYDIIHINDWMTVPAGILLKEKGKPMIFHLHSTEYDRTNEKPRQWVVEIEKLGAQKADLVIANSFRTKRELIELYGINENKIRVVYNGINLEKFAPHNPKKIKKSEGKIVLFVGRLTIQKGIWHLLQAAKKVLEKSPETKFIFVGKGPDLPFLIKTSIELGIEKSIIFTGKISDEELLAAYKMCDVFVMPSVSEPFGIVALEALASGKPLIISKTSGVCEILKHCFKVDFWDIEIMASRILETLNYDSLNYALSQNGLREVQKLSWKNSAKACVKVYEALLHA